MADVNLDSENKEVFEIIQDVLGTLHNLLQKYPESQPILRDTGIQDVLFMLLDLENATLRAMAVLTLTYVIDWRRSHDEKLIEIINSNIDFMVNEMLAKFTSADDRQKEMIFGKLESGLTFTADEVLQPLSCLAKNRQNAVELIKQGVISKCEAILLRLSTQKFTSDIETNHSLASKWALTLLSRVNKHGMSNNLINFSELLSKFQTHPVDDIGEIADGLLHDIRIGGKIYTF